MQLLAALIEARSGAARAAAELLVAEAERVEPVDPVRAATMIMAAVQPCFEAGENALMLETRAARDGARRAGGPRPDARRPAAGDGAPALQRARRARDLLVSAAAWLEAADDPWALGPVLIFGIGQAFTWLEDYDRARGLLEGGIAQARAWSAPGLLPYGLLAMSELEFRTGRWASAYAAGAEAARLGEETGAAERHGLRALRAQPRRGRARATSRIAGPTWRTRSRWSSGSERESLRAHVGATLGFLELGLGRAEEAVVALEAVERFLGARPANDPAVLQWAPDLVEALRRATAAARTPRRRWPRSSRTPRTAAAAGRAATAARCRGLLADEEAFEGEFASALGLHETPFESARTELALGERQRRAGRRVEARDEPARGAGGIRPARRAAMGGAGAGGAARVRRARPARLTARRPSG